MGLQALLGKTDAVDSYTDLWVQHIDRPKAKNPDHNCIRFTVIKAY